MAGGGPWAKGWEAAVFRHARLYLAPLPVAPDPPPLFVWAIGPCDADPPRRIFDDDPAAIEEPEKESHA